MIEQPEAVPRFPLAWPVGWVRTLPGRRKVATFSTKQATDGRLSVRAATLRLQGEIDRLGARGATLSTNVQLRLDGAPRSDQEPADPGAAVYFTFKGRATVFACDRYRRVADNIAAIAAHIDAIRRIDRYGVGSLEQALAGYKALPADTAADWRTVLGFPGGSAPRLPQLEAKYKQLAREKHPDHGGTEEGWHQLARAYEFARTELAG